jgi:hypothetical protein
MVKNILALALPRVPRESYACGDRDSPVVEAGISLWTFVHKLRNGE